MLDITCNLCYSETRKESENMSEEELQERLWRKQEDIYSDAPSLLIFDNIKEKNDFMLKDIKLFNEKVYLCYAKDELSPDVIDNLNFKWHIFM